MAKVYTTFNARDQLHQSELSTSKEIKHLTNVQYFSTLPVFLDLHHAYYVNVHLSAFSEVTFRKHQRTLKQHLSVVLLNTLKRKLDSFLDNVYVHPGRAQQSFYFMNIHSLKFTLKGVCRSFYSKRTSFKSSVLIILQLLSITITVNLNVFRKSKSLLKLTINGTKPLVPRMFGQLAIVKKISFTKNLKIWIRQRLIFESYSILSFVRDLLSCEA